MHKKPTPKKSRVQRVLVIILAVAVVNVVIGAAFVPSNRPFSAATTITEVALLFTGIEAVGLVIYVCTTYWRRSKKSAAEDAHRLKTAPHKAVQL